VNRVGGRQQRETRQGEYIRIAMQTFFLVNPEPTTDDYWRLCLDIMKILNEFRKGRGNEHEY
jgi:hypothetical protein